MIFMAGRHSNAWLVFTEVTMYWVWGLKINPYIRARFGLRLNPSLIARKIIYNKLTKI